MKILKIILAHIASRLTKSKFPITTLEQWKSLDIHQRRKLLSFGFGFFDRCHDCKIPFTYRNFKGEPSGLFYHKGFAHGTYRMDSWFEPSDELVVQIISHPDDFLNLDEKLNSLKTRIFKPKQSRNSKMTLDKEDQAVLRSIVRNETIPSTNELLKEFSDLKAEVRTLRARLAVYEPEEAPQPPRPVAPPPAPKPTKTTSSRKASSTVVPFLKSWWQKQFITAEEANKIEGFLTDVPGTLKDPLLKTSRQDASEHKKERAVIFKRFREEMKARGVAVGQKDREFIQNFERSCSNGAAL